MPAKVQKGNKIRIKKQVALDAENKFILEVGETFTVEAVGSTGTVRISKQFPNGVFKRAEVSKTYFERV